MRKVICPECGARGEMRGTYRSRYGFRYRRYACLAVDAHRWREDIAGNRIVVPRGRRPLAEELRLLKPVVPC